MVPILPGMIGAWEPYTLGNGDLTINAVYTPATESNVPDVPPLPDETEAPDETAPVTDPADTDEPAKKGCRSALGISLATPILLAAAVVLGKKRDRL